MSNRYRRLQPATPPLVSRVDDLRETLQQIPVEVLAERTGARYQVIGPGRGEFRLSLIGMPITITFPDFRFSDAQDNGLPPFFQAMVMYYFDSPEAAPMRGKWISFADLPDGRVYDSAFQGNTGNLLVKTYGLDIEALWRACENLGGTALSGFGEAAFVIQALPRIPMMVNYWQGDEDFPSSCKLLFDQSVSRYLPTEACAVLGGLLTQKLIKIVV